MSRFGDRFKLKDSVSIKFKPASKSESEEGADNEKSIPNHKTMDDCPQKDKR